MNQFIQLPAERLRTIYEEAQARRGLPARSIEKDLWDYAAMRAEMFFGPTAEFDVVLKAVGEFLR